MVVMFLDMSIFYENSELQIKLQTSKIFWAKSTGSSYSPTPLCLPGFLIRSDDSHNNNDSNNNDNNSNNNDHNDSNNNSASGELMFQGFRPSQITRHFKQ